MFSALFSKAKSFLTSKLTSGMGNVLRRFGDTAGGVIRNMHVQAPSFNQGVNTLLGQGPKADAVNTAYSIASGPMAERMAARISGWGKRMEQGNLF
jgi:hypothetical protein